MESRAKFLGHPVHPMLIVLPLGLFIAAVVFDAPLSVARITDLRHRGLLEHRGRHRRRPSRSSVRSDRLACHS